MPAALGLGVVGSDAGAASPARSANHGSGSDIGPGEYLSFYQPIHRKRIINGMLARAPLAALAYYRASPAFMFFAQEAVSERTIIVQDLRAKVRELRIGYVVLHTDSVATKWQTPCDIAGN